MKELTRILHDLDQGNISSTEAETQVLNLFSVMPRSYGVVRWYDNRYKDVVCVNREKAQEYVKKYNDLAVKKECYVDEDIYLPLDET